MAGLLDGVSDYLGDAWDYYKKKPLGILSDIKYPWDVAASAGSSLLAPTQPSQGYDQTTAPANMQPSYAALAPDPNAEYGKYLPVARDKTTGEHRLALPSSVQCQLALGALDTSLARRPAR